MIVNFSIFPVGKGESLSSYIAETFEIIAASGLHYEHHSMGTNIEGEWNEVISVIDQCRVKMLESSTRVHISISIDDRRGQLGRMDKKVKSAQAKR